MIGEEEKSEESEFLWERRPSSKFPLFGRVPTLVDILCVGAHTDVSNILGQQIGSMLVSCECDESCVYMGVWLLTMNDWLYELYKYTNMGGTISSL